MANDTAIEVLFHAIDFGMLAINCPGCDNECTGVFVALTTLEDEDNPTDEEGMPNMVQMGIIRYPCTHVFMSPCLTDKVAMILNDREANRLRLSQFLNLIECKDHGVEFPGQS